MKAIKVYESLRIKTPNFELTPEQMKRDIRAAFLDKDYIYKLNVDKDLCVIQFKYYETDESASYIRYSPTTKELLCTFSIGMMWSHYIHKDPVETFDEFVDIMSRTHVTDIPELDEWINRKKKVSEGLIIKNPNLSIRALSPETIVNEISNRLKYDVAQINVQEFDEHHPNESRIEIKVTGCKLTYFVGRVYAIHVDGILRSTYALKQKMKLQEFIDWLPEFDKEEMHNYSPLWDYRGSSMY